MKFKRLRSVLLLSILFFTVVISFAQKKTADRKVSMATPENNFAKNGIKLKSKGFKVSEAYLVLDDESLVPEGNKVELNQNVNMLLIIDEGWNETGGRVFPGSSQVIKQTNGAIIANSEELFEAFNETGVSPEDAHYIIINAMITDLKYKKNYAVVNVKVWDKKGSAEITGSYKLFIN